MRVQIATGRVTVSSCEARNVLPQAFIMSRRCREYVIMVNETRRPAGLEF
jgi:hypothetical protein